MMSRFWQRLTTKMLQDVNDVISGHKTVEQIVTEAEDYDEGHDHDDDLGEGFGRSDGEGNVSETKEEPSKGTLILDATCASDTGRDMRAAGDTVYNGHVPAERSPEKHRRKS